MSSLELLSRVLGRSALKYNTEILFKRGCIEQLGPLVASTTRRVLVITSMGGYERVGGYLQFLLQRSGVGVQHYVTRENYNDFEDPSLTGVLGAGNMASVAAVNGALRIGEHTGCQAVIGVGGGAIQDIARCTAMAMYDKSVLQTLESPASHMINRGLMMNATAPFFSVATNPGAGSELSGSCVMVGEDSRRTTVHCDIENSEKLPQRVLPHAVLVDLDLSKETSQPRIAANAITAYTQCASQRALFGLLRSSDGDSLAPEALDAGMRAALDAIDCLTEGDVPGSQEHVAMASLFAGACQHHDTDTNGCVGGLLGCLSASVQEHLSDLEGGREYTYAEAVVGLSSPLLTLMSEHHQGDGVDTAKDVAKLQQCIDAFIGAEKAALQAPEDGMFDAIVSAILNDTVTRMGVDLPQPVFDRLRETVASDDSLNQLLRTIKT